jgi:hypothetical protein
MSSDSGERETWQREYLADWIPREYGYKGCCTADGYSRKQKKWTHRRRQDQKLFTHEQQLQCVDCGRPFSEWKPVMMSAVRDIR